MKKDVIIILVVILLLLILCLYFRNIGSEETQEGREKQCEFDSDCFGENICFQGQCEPFSTGIHHCLGIPVTGKIIVTPEESCLLTYDDFRVTKFCATWNRSIIRYGGYVVTWGPSVMQYGTNGLFGQARVFEKQFAIIPHRDFMNDGQRFLKSRGGIIPCDDNESVFDQYYGTPATTPFKVYPIRLWQRVHEYSASYDNNTMRIVVSFSHLLTLEGDISVDEYAIEIQIPLQDFTIFRGSFLEAMGSSNVVEIQLFPEDLMNISNPTSSNSWFKVEIFGYRKCNEGIAAAGSGTAMF